jgi:isopenicillin-N N-acyltransferase-like protein
MLKKRKKIWRILFWTLASIAGLLLALFIYLLIVAIDHPPTIKNRESESWQRTDHGNGFYTLKNNWFRKSNSGLYELYVEGDPFERGVVNGKLTQELVRRQEDNFNEQIAKLVPSNFYRHFLKYFVGWFNRHLDENVTEEYKESIYGVSLAASEKYNYIGSNYQRILNYHAAHDIGHALQTMALVGCTSFGTWGARSEDSTLIIGRNFDFYVGDKFAEDKIVAFFNPSTGHRYMTVTWGGFLGTVSGMNELGLSVTINAAKTAMPTASATPVSLVATEILQYASNIKEALAIASKRKMFVSESFLIGSAADNKAVVIEKTPTQLAVYDPQKNYILCANHFQSDSLSNIEKNVEQLKESASPYRYKRLVQLMEHNGVNTVAKTVAILRDTKGINNADIGLGNEKALNQLLAHHSIVFEPQKRLVWVSTSPWQLGKFIAYDLNKVFAMQGMKDNKEIYDSALTIPADSLLFSKQFQNYIRYRTLKQLAEAGNEINIDELIAGNPNYYHTYVIAGDYLYKRENYNDALRYYEVALTKEIATQKEADYISKQIEKCNKRL